MAPRYFLPELPAPGPLSLDGALAHHLGSVLRVRPGETIRLADGRGASAPASVVRVTRRLVEVVVSAADRAAPPPIRVHLAFAVPRAQRAEWLFEHGTEVGVSIFRPLRTARTRPSADRTARWTKLVTAAAGQCDRDWLPEVREPVELTAFLAEPDLPSRRLVADPDGQALPAVDGDVALLVGPEGGFTADERTAIAESGFAPVRLGPHVLRTETAALVGAARLMP